MKKINILWMLIGCLFLVTSCSDDDDSAVASLQVIKSDVSFLINKSFAWFKLNPRPYYQLSLTPTLSSSRSLIIVQIRHSGYARQHTL